MKIMEVLESCSEILSNRQVLNLLKNYTSKKQTNLATILYETTSYLESSPTESTSIANIATFLDIIKERGYELTKIEKIQLVNLKPQNLVELQLIVANLRKRFNDQQIGDILELIKSTLSSPVPARKNEQARKKVKN